MGTEHVADMLQSLDRVGLLDPSQGSYYSPESVLNMGKQHSCLWSMTETNSLMILNTCPMLQFSTSG